MKRFKDALHGLMSNQEELASKFPSLEGVLMHGSVVAYALLDSRAKDSFISESFAKRLGIIPEALDLGFRVSILSGDKMFTSQIVKRLELRLQKNTVREDLIVLPLPEFNIIMDMDCFLRTELLYIFYGGIVTVTEPVSQRLEDMKVVRDFPSIFPVDVLGIPPDI
ncbi:uncharacterized protein [Primulina eburnea]|uniref:uncharacterized protein n=1 Tax=Primulina eburnea TaxID=1245227 RepID=UPI003C6C928D